MVRSRCGIVQTDPDPGPTWTENLQTTTCTVYTKCCLATVKYSTAVQIIATTGTRVDRVARARDGVDGGGVHLLNPTIKGNKASPNAERLIAPINYILPIRQLETENADA